MNIKQYDITNKQKALTTLSNWLNVESKSISRYLETHTKNYSAEDFVETMGIRLDEYDLKTLNIVGIHVTSNEDECHEIKQIGLLDLNQVLRKQTSLTNFLKEHHIEFDLDNHQINYNGKRVSLLDHSMKVLYQKIYQENQIHAFFRVGDFGYHSAKMIIRPEILTMLAHLFDDQQLLYFWDLNNETFVIKFSVPIDEVDLSSIALSSCKEDIMMQLIFYALDVILLDEYVELCFCLKDGKSIQSTSILDIHPFYNT